MYCQSKSAEIDHRSVLLHLKFGKFGFYCLKVYVGSVWMFVIITFKNFPNLKIFLYNLQQYQSKAWWLYVGAATNDYFLFLINLLVILWFCLSHVRKLQQFPKGHGDVFTLLSLFNQQSQTQRYSVYCYTRQRKVANHHSCEAGTKYCLAFILKKGKDVKQFIIKIVASSIIWNLLNIIKHLDYSLFSHIVSVSLFSYKWSIFCQTCTLHEFLYF